MDKPLNHHAVTLQQGQLSFRLLASAGLILWFIGLVDLLRQLGDIRTIFRIPFPIFVTFFGSGLLVWLVLLAKSGWLAGYFWRAVRRIQETPWQASYLIVALIGIGAAFLLVPQFARLPFLQPAMVALVLVGLAVLIFSGSRPWRKVLAWRKTMITVLVALLAIEGGFQILALGGGLPGTYDIAGLYTPHGRVYFTEEGFGNGVTNNFGWYYPNFRLEDDSYRVLILGDTFVQGLQVEPTQNVGVRLEEFLHQSQPEQRVEVLALGMPGFGPGLYLSLTRLEHAIQVFEPNEIIVFFNLGSDFQATTQPSGYDLYYLLEDGHARIHDDSYKYEHDLKHLIVDGYDPLGNAATLVSSHWLTPKIVRQWLTGQAQAARPDGNEYDIPGFKGVVAKTRRLDQTHNIIDAVDLVPVPGKNNFMFETGGSQRAEEALAVAKSWLHLANDFAEIKGVDLKIVTIPAFPPAFYTKFQGREWQPQLGPYDLFKPERALHEFAESKGIPFLSMGQWLVEQGVPVEEIQSLYFEDGLGHLTANGHAYFAETTFNCFYAVDNNLTVSTTGSSGTSCMK